MTNLRFILSIALLILASMVVVMNWVCVIVSIRNHRRGIDQHHSTVPVISIVFVVIAALIHPGSDPEARWMLVIPLLDIGNWIVLGGLLWLPMALIRDARRK